MGEEGILERLVKALETIAENMKGGKPEISGPAGPLEMSTVPDQKEQEEFNYPKFDDREAWLKECEKRGITVPDRTRTSTLVKMVSEWDKQIESEKEPTDSPNLIEDSDPFGTGEVESKAYILEQVRDTVAAYITKHGKDKALALYHETTGLMKFDGLPENLFGKVMDAFKED